MNAAISGIRKTIVRRIFTDWDNLKFQGIYFSGVHGDGEFKKWYDNGQMWEHCFYKNGKIDGVYRRWHENGTIYIHSLFKEGEFVEDYLK